MKKIIAYILVICSLTILVVSTSKPLMEKVSDAREKAPWGSWWSSHSVKNAGDLAKMAYLERVPQFKDTNIIDYKRQEQGNGNIDLYLFGDSYVKNIPDSAFYGLNSFHFGRRDYYDLNYNLDTSKTNILVIAIAERYVRTYFHFQDSIYKHVKRGEPTQHHTKLLRPRHNQVTHAGFGDFDIDVLFNESVNQNIEYNVFTYNFLTSVRTLKANLNYYFFNRASGDVVISDNGEFLFIKESVNDNNYSSSYVEVPEPLVSYYISIFNPIHEHYKNEGFDEVYLSILPNPASVLQPENYNGFIPDLQNPERGYRLYMPVIDVYSTFIENGAEKYYLHGDTHWNIVGTKVWLDKVNKELRCWDSLSIHQ